MFQPGIAQTGIATPVTVYDVLPTLPVFDGHARSEGYYEDKRRLGTAYYRLVGPWFPAEEWFVLKYDAASNTLLCLHRFGHDRKRDEFLPLAPTDLDAVRGPQGQPLMFDFGFTATALGGIL